MDIRFLNGFVTAAELGSITLAAEKLHISQSALSRQIQSLEETLGVDLFERVGKKIRLSPTGEALLSKINDVVVAGRTLKTSADGMRKDKGRVLKVGACSQVIERFFPTFLPVWSAAHPFVEIRLEEGGGAELHEKLREGAIQVALNASTYLGDDVDGVKIGHLDIVAVGQETLIGATADPIDISDLCTVPLLLLGSRHASREMFDAACRLAGVVPTVALESASPHTVCSLAESGVGVAVVPAGAPLTRPGLRARPVVLGSRPLGFDLHAMWSRKEALPFHAQDFVSALGAHIGQPAEAFPEPARVVPFRRDRG